MARARDLVGADQNRVRQPDVRCYPGVVLPVQCPAVADDPADVVEPEDTFKAREELRASIDRYCAYHGIVPAYTILYVFDRRRWARPSPPGEPVVLPRAALVALDDDDAWLAISPVGRRWWDIDLYPELAKREGVVAISTSPEAAETPTTRPAGIFVRHDWVLIE